MFLADGINYVICRLDKDCKRKKVERHKKKVECERKKAKCENQCHSMLESLDMVDFVCDEVPTFNSIVTLQRKYNFVVDNFHDILFKTMYKFANEDRQHVLIKFLDNDDVQGLLLDFTKGIVNIECKLAFLENLKTMYVQFVTQKSKENLPYTNAFLTAVVSNEVGPSQRYICKIFGGSRYLLSKAITRKVHVNLIEENIWGRLPWKWCSNVVAKGDHELILKFWDIATTISTNQKDMK